MKLSVCIIARNEEEVIARCLSGLRVFADEIVVVDTGSTDRTAEIAKNFTDKVYFYKWNDDFSAARNFSFEKANCDLVMWLDADDVISSDNARKIAEVKDRMGDYDMAFLMYAAAFDGDRPTFTYYRERIFRRKNNYRWQGAVHECIAPQGKILYSDACIWHKKVKPSQPMRNLHIYQKVISQGKPLSGRDKFYYGRELFYNGMYRESIAVLQDFLNGDGWAENKAEACITLYYAYSKIGDGRQAINSLLNSFAVSEPKSQACCIMGDYFLNRKEYRTAIFWYKTAAHLQQNIKSGAFVNTDYCGYIPFMQLCVAYDSLGDYKTAYRYNELAGSIKPQDTNYLYNKKYFTEKFGSEND